MYIHICTYIQICIYTFIYIIVYMVNQRCVRLHFYIPRHKHTHCAIFSLLESKKFRGGITVYVHVHVHVHVHVYVSDSTLHFLCTVVSIGRLNDSVYHKTGRRIWQVGRRSLPITGHYFSELNTPERDSSSMWASY